MSIADVGERKRLKMEQGTVQLSSKVIRGTASIIKAIKAKGEVEMCTSLAERMPVIKKYVTDFVKHNNQDGNLYLIVWEDGSKALESDC